MQQEHTRFAGVIPENYDQYMGPLFFEPFALDLVQRIHFKVLKRVLEIACGTGRATRHLAQRLPPDATLTATDLNAGMLHIAQQKTRQPNVQFKEADAQQLPFDNHSFDLVVCQFGYMFVSDKQQAFKEAYRVLKQGGSLLFNTWDSLENNALTLTIKNIVAKYGDEKAAAFYDVPFAMNDQQAIATWLINAGFKQIHLEVVSKESTGITPEAAAKGLIMGTPAFNVLAAKDETAPARLVEKAGNILAGEAGKSTITTIMHAVVCEAVKQ